MVEKRVCKKCSKEKSIEEFEIANKNNGKEYRRWTCRACKYQSDLERIEEKRKWFAEYKSELDCEMCGFDDSRALVFHHEDPSEKEYNVSDMINSDYSVEKILDEINKCVVLCANCHMILHHKERQ